MDLLLRRFRIDPSTFQVSAAPADIFAEGIKTRGRNLWLNVKDTLDKGVGQDIQERGTALWAINGLTSYYQNVANFSNEEIKFDSLMGGNAYNKIQKAQELLLAVA